MSDPLHLAVSPCPNDTFTYHGWITGTTPGPAVRWTAADIDVTNAATARGAYDVAKISYAALPSVLEDYRLLPCGGALGRGVGPLVLAASQRPPSSLRGARVAVPGLASTAALLLRLWEEAEVAGGLGDLVVLRYDRIGAAVLAGEVDVGLVIHESRFTYARDGLSLVADLGAWWEAGTGLPVPLGAVVARRSLDPAPLVAAVRASLDHAWAHPEDSRAMVLAHAAEPEEDVVRRHVETYVTRWTRELGDDGAGAVRALLGRAAAAGLVAGGDPLR